MNRSYISLCGGCVLFVFGVVLAFAGMTATAEEAQTITIEVSPQTIVLGSKGGTVVVHADIKLSAVDRTSVELNGLKPYFTEADARGNLVAKFRLAAVKAIVAPPSATMTFTGCTVQGELFSGTDEVRVID